MGIGHDGWCITLDSKTGGHWTTIQITQHYAELAGGWLYLGGFLKAVTLERFFFSLYFILIYELTLNVTLSIDDIYLFL